VSIAMSTCGKSNFDLRPRRRRVIWHIRTWTVQSCSPGGANIHRHVTHASFGPLEHTTQTASRSVQPLLHSSRHSVFGHVRACFSRTIVPSHKVSGPHVIYGSFSLPEPTTQTVSRSVHRFAQMMQSVSILYNGTPLPHSKYCPFPLGDLDPI